MRPFIAIAIFQFLLFRNHVQAATAATVHVVAVGNDTGILTFTPNNMVAAVGDFVQFQFHPVNHSVVQSNFDSPCQPMTTGLGFFSGFMPVTAQSSTTPTYTISINNTDAIYYYCSQGKHCQAGMVGSINAGTSLLAQFAAGAKGAASNITPGSTTSAAIAQSETATSQTTTSQVSSIASSESTTATPQPTNAGGTPSLGSIPSSGSTSTPVGSSASASSTGSESTPKSQSSGASPGLIAGVVLGTAAIILVAVGLWILWKRTNILSKRGNRPRTSFFGKSELDGEPASLKGLKVSELEVVERPLELNGRRQEPIYELPI
ncbi:putative GPI-anchored cupredoxin, partial [Lachnellula suecica]